MKITPTHLEHLLQHPQQDLCTFTLIGMSNIGKSYWAQRLGDAYPLLRHVHFDGLIDRALAASMESYATQLPETRLAAWLGMPWSPGFTHREKLYLFVEQQLMQTHQLPGSLLDLTGSCAHHPEALKNIASTGLVVYLDTAPDMTTMLAHYFAHPKPVCWGGLFEKRDSESPEDALHRCYPLLLAFRKAAYAAVADVTIPYEVHRNTTTVSGFLSAIIKQL